MALVDEAPDHPGGGFGGVAGGQAQGLVAEVHLLLADVAPQQHLVAGGAAAVDPSLRPEEADVRRVVLSAGVGAPGDVDADAAHIGQPLVLEALADGVAQAATLGDGQVAGVRPGAGHHVAGQLRARAGHADGVQAVVDSGQIVGVQAPEHDVLAVGQPHVGVEFALQRGKGPELVTGDVTQMSLRVDGDRAVAHAPNHVDPFPPLVGGARADSDRRAVAHRGDGGGISRTGRVVAVDLHLGRDPARPGGRRHQELALGQHPALDLLETERVHQPLHAGPQLVVAVAGLVEHPQAGLDGG